MQDTMLLLIKGILGFLGLVTIGYLSLLDKRFPDSAPTDTVVYYIIGGYIIFVFAGAEAVGEALKIIVNKIPFINNNKKSNEG